MQLVASISIPLPYHEQGYTLTPDEIKRERQLKLSSDQRYVYMALRMSYKVSNPIIDIPSFCETWDISEEDCRVIIAALHKKGCLQAGHKQLELELYSPQEALDFREEAKSAAKDKEKSI